MAQDRITEQKLDESINGIMAMGEALANRMGKTLSDFDNTKLTNMLEELDNLQDQPSEECEECERPIESDWTHCEYCDPQDYDTIEGEE